MSSVAVTGATGFVAGHLIRRLRSEGYRVIPVTRKSIEGMVTVSHYGNVPEADLIIHLAEEPDRGKVNEQGDSYVELSSGVVRELAARFRGRLIYASSASVYGDKGSQPFSAKSKTYATDIYSLGKLANEAIVAAADGIILRFSNVYGKGMSANNVLSDIIKQLAGDAPIVVRNKFPVRDYISVTEVSDLFVEVLRQYHKGIYNVGSGIGISVYELVELVLSITGQKGREIQTLQNTNPQSYNVLDVRETEDIFGWSPDRNMTHHLEELTISYGIQNQ